MDVSPQPRNEARPPSLPVEGEGSPGEAARSPISAPGLGDPLAEFFFDPEEETLALPELTQGFTTRRDEAAEPDQRVELLAFRLGREDYALEIAWVREIVKPPPMAEVPRVAPAILGVISLRGEAVPVFSLARLLGLSPEIESMNPTGKDSRLIVIEVAKGPAALEVHEVFQVIRLPGQAIEPPPRGLSRGAAAEFLQGIGRHQGRLFAILDPRALFPEASA